MLEFRKLKGEDVATLDHHAADDPDGTARISLSAAQWWELVRTDPRRHGWIIQLDGDAIGYLDAEQDLAQDPGESLQLHTGSTDEQDGAHQQDTVVYLALLLFPNARGRGLAHHALHQALALPELTAATVLLAYVEPDNHPARHVLIRAGFTADGADADGLTKYRRPPLTRDQQVS